MPAAPIGYLAEEMYTAWRESLTTRARPQPWEMLRPSAQAKWVEVAHRFSEALRQDGYYIRDLQAIPTRPVIGQRREREDIYGRTPGT